MNEDINLKTLRVVVNEYLKTEKNARRQRDLRSVFNQFCIFMPRGLHVSDLKPEDYTNFLNSKREVLSDRSYPSFASRLKVLRKYIDSCRSEPKRLGQARIRPSVSASKKEHRKAIKEKAKQHQEEIEEYRETINRLEEQHRKDEDRHRKDKAEKAMLESEAEDYSRQIYVLEHQVEIKQASEEHLDRLNTQIRQKQEKVKELDTELLSDEDAVRKLALIDQYPDWEKRFEGIEQLARVEAEKHDLEKENERLKANLKEANKKLEDKERVEAENRDLAKKLETSHLVVETLGSIDKAIYERSNEILENIRHSRERLTPS